MKDLYNPLRREFIPEKFTADTPLLVMRGLGRDSETDYYKNPYRYMDELLAAGRDCYTEAMEEVGGLWNYCVHADEKAGLEEQQGEFSCDDPEAQAEEAADIAAHAQKIATGTVITITDHDGDETTCATVGEALEYFAGNFEATDDEPWPRVYFMTDADCAAEMRAAVAEKNNKINKHWGLVIGNAIFAHGKEFNFPETLKVYHENQRLYESLIESREII